jgi:MFS family permease
MTSLRVRLSITVVVVLIAALVYISFRTVERAQALLEPELESKAATVADSTAALIGRALDVGIPFDRIEGLNAYLGRILDNNPDLATIVVRDASGRAVYGAGGALDASARTVTAPIGAKDNRTELLLVGLEPSYARRIVSALWVDLAIIMLVTALIALELIYVGFGTGLYGAIEGVEKRLRTLRRGDLRMHLPVESGSEFERIAHALDDRLKGLHETYASFRERASERGDHISQQALDLVRHRFGLGEAMIAAPMSVIAVRAPLFVFMLAEELTRPFLPVYIRQLATPIPGLSPEFVVSLPMVAFLVVVALAQPLFGNLTDRLGRRRSLILGAGLGLVGYCAAAAVTGLIGLTLARVVSALGFAFVFVSAQGFVIDATDIRQRSSGMAMFISAILVAGLCGPPIGGILADRVGIAATFVIAGLFAAASLVLAVLCMPPDSARKEHAPAVRWRDFAPILASPRLTGLFFLCAMPAKIILVAFCFFLVPLEIGALGVTQATTGRMLMIYPVAMVLLVPVFASLADRWDMRTGFVVIGGLVAGASAFAMLLGADQIAPLALMLFGLGVGQAISIAPLSGLVGELSRELPTDVSETSVYGIFRLFERTGSAFGPLIAGALLGLYQFQMTVIIIGAATGLSALLFGALIGLMRQPKVGVPAPGV